MALTALLAAAAPCLIWAVVTYGQLRGHLDRAGPLALEWSSERVRGRLEGAAGEVARIGAGLATALTGRRAGDPRTNELASALHEALGASETFAALLVVDPSGELLAVAGSTPGLERVLHMLQPGSALEADLETVMRGANLRKELGSVEQASVRVLDVPQDLPLALGCAPISGARGRGVLHGLVRRDAIAAVLRSGPLGSQGSVRLIDAEGREIAATGGDAVTADAGTELWSEALRLLGRGWNLHYEQPLEELGWTLVAEASVLEGFRPLALALSALLVMPLASALFFATLAHVVATRLARPLWRLYEAMRKAALETELVEVDVPSAEGEARSLILAFNVTIRRLQQQRAESERSNRALREQNQAFQAQHETLAKLTVTDALTQLSNRRHFEEQLDIEIKRLSRHNEALAILVIDIDDFKMLNDRHGHAAGDEFLRQVARILREGVRATDMVARYGGEEFVVVATGTNLDGAIVLAEKLRMAVADASFIVDETKRPRRATVSIGVAEYRGSQTDLFNSADAALYEAKGAGKDCVVAARSDD